MGKGYMTDMFKQLEEISKKLDASLQKINEQSLIIYNLNLEIKKLNYPRKRWKNYTIIRRNRQIKKQK